MNEDDIYLMTVGFPDTEDKELSDKMNYYIDCLYRMCSFSGESYKPRTYDQFLKMIWERKSNFKNGKKGKRG